MIDEKELRHQIALALSGRLSLDDLYIWLMSRSWNMHKDSSSAAIALANEVEDLFFDRSEGFLGESSMHSRLASLLHTITWTAEVGDAVNAMRPIQKPRASSSWPWNADVAHRTHQRMTAASTFSADLRWEALSA